MNTSRTLPARSARCATYTSVAKLPNSNRPTIHPIARARPRSTNRIHAPTNASPAYRSTSVVTPHLVAAIVRNPADNPISIHDIAMDTIKPIAHIPHAAPIIFAPFIVCLRLSPAIFIDAPT